MRPESLSMEALDNVAPIDDDELVAELEAIMEAEKAIRKEKRSTIISSKMLEI